MRHLVQERAAAVLVWEHQREDFLQVLLDKLLDRLRINHVILAISCGNALELHFGSAAWQLAQGDEDIEVEFMCFRKEIQRLRDFLAVILKHGLILPVQARLADPLRSLRPLPAP